MNYRQIRSVKRAAALGLFALSTLVLFAQSGVPPAITGNPQTEFIGPGATASFTVGATGTAPLSYQWTFNGAVIPLATAATLTLTNVHADQAGNYAAIVTNAFGGEASSVVPLELYNVDAFTTLAGVAGNVGGSNGSGSAANFDQPAGLAVDASGNIYVADSLNNTIRLITPAGATTTFAGSLGAPGSLDGKGGAASFANPTAIAIDSAGNLYVADTGNDTIRKITPDGTVATLAGSPGLAGGADGTGALARFFHPAGVAVDGAGNLYVADTGNNTVRKIAAGGVVTTLAGLPGQTGGIDGTGSSASFNGPTGIAVDSAGKIYVADTGTNTIRKISSGNVVTTIAGELDTAGSADGPAEFSLFNAPAGLAVDQFGNIYIADRGNHTVRAITNGAGINAATVGGVAGQAGSADGPEILARFNHPAGIALDSARNIYVADTGNDTIRVGVQPVRPTIVSTAPGNLNVNAGQNVTFSAIATGNPVPALQWEKQGSAILGATGATLTLTGVQLGDAASYDVIATSVGGSISAFDGILTVNAAPAITQQPVSQTVNPGVEVIFSVEVTGYPNPTYQWLFDGVPITGGAIGGGNNTLSSPVVGATSATLQLLGAYAGAAGSYTVQLLNSSGTITSAAATLVVNSPPAFSTPPASETVAQGASATFLAVASGSPAPSYQWYFNGSLLTGATGATLTVANGQAQNAGSYTVVATNPLGSATSAAAVLTVTAPPAVSIPPTSLVNVGGTLKLSVVAIGTGPFTYQWQKNGVNLAGATGTTLSLVGVGASDAAVYGIVVMNPYGSTTGTAVVTIAAGYYFSTLAGLPPGSQDGTGTAARFDSPFGVAIDSGGNIYVADSASDVIRMVTPAGVVTTLAGQTGGAGSADGTASAARFSQPEGLAIDSSGNLFVADSGNATIRRITPAGFVTTVAGLAGNTGSIDGSGALARFNSPTGVAVDSSGNLYVADTGNQTIRKIDGSGNVTTLAGGNGLFSNPRGVAVDGGGNVYVADSGNNVIRIIYPAGGVGVLAGLASSQTDMEADGLGEHARFAEPWAVAVDAAGNLYVTDLQGYVVRKVTAAGAVTTLAGKAGMPGAGDGVGTAATFGYLTGVAVDVLGNAYVVDNYYGTVRIITPAAAVSTLAGSPAAVSLGRADGIGAGARFSSPGGVAADGSGNVYVADSGNSTVRKIAPGGIVTTLAGNGSEGVGDGFGAAAQFSIPYALTLGPDAALYVADSQNDTIRRVDLLGDVTTVAGAANFAGNLNGMGIGARFNLPTGIASDASGNLYVADTLNDTVRLITPAGVVTTLAGLPGVPGTSDGVGSSARFNQPSQVAIDGAGTLYVADTGNNTVRKVTPSGAVSTLAGLAGSVGQSDGTGANARFGLVIGIVADPSGNLFVTDNNTVRMITPAGLVTTLAGQHGRFGADSGTGSGALFNFLFDITMDGSGNLYVAEAGNNAIRLGTPIITPAILAPPSSQTVALGGAVTLSVRASGAGDSYQWSVNGRAITGATQASLTLNNVQPGDAGSYAATVTNPAGAATSAAAVVMLAPGGGEGAQAVAGSGYVAGQTVTITNTITYTGTASSLGWSVLLPTGWSFAGSSGSVGDGGPGLGNQGELGWTWSSPPASPVTFSYTVNVPAGTTGSQSLAAVATLRLGASTIQVIALPDPLMVGPTLYHSADENHDGEIELLELTRVIELYNTHSGATRTGAYLDQAGTEDGFAPDPTRGVNQTVTLSYYHSADEHQAGAISLLELTRVIEFYNYHSGTVRTGQYHVQSGTEDGFAPGP